MTARRIRISFAILTIWASAGQAEAQSPPTCSFDPATATVTVTVNGQAAELRAPVGTGDILLDRVSCGGATVSNTESIQVNGGGLQDDVTLAGRFAPGATPEGTGGSEIEIGFALGSGYDHVIVDLTVHRDVVVFTSDGIDIGNDLDRDILTAGVEDITVNGLEGNDRIDASAYTSRPPAPHSGLVQLRGGSGDDRLFGSLLLTNWMHGDDGNDRIYGGAAADSLTGGPGGDLLVGRGGDDAFLSYTTDGADEMRGGEGVDEVAYQQRVNGVTVTIGNGLADDGEAGEGDNVAKDVENVYGGRGPDVLVGTDVANRLGGGRATTRSTAAAATTSSTERPAATSWSVTTATTG